MGRDDRYVRYNPSPNETLRCVEFGRADRGRKVTTETATNATRLLPICTPDGRLMYCFERALPLHPG